MKKEKKQSKSIKAVNKEVVEQNPVIILSKEKSEKTFGEAIEAKRKSLFGIYKKTSRTSTVMMFVVVIVFVVAFICYNQPGWGQAVCWSLIGITMAAMIGYFIFTKNLYPSASKDYFKVFWKETNEYIFSATEFSDCKIDEKERYVLPEVITDKVYKNVTDSASRNIVRGNYKGKSFAFGELAYYVAGDKRGARKVIFVGRHLALSNTLEFEGRYIVNIKGEKDMDLPNDIEDLKPLIEHNKFVVYGPENGDPVKVLGKDLIENLKTIECTGNLLNVNIVFWAGHTAAYLSYDDSIVAIPFEHEFNVAAYESLRKNVMTIFEVLE